MSPHNGAHHARLLGLRSRRESSDLRSYGFRALGNSKTFMMLDRRDADEESMRGNILLNLDSDDGLASIDNSILWNRFILDFKKAFDVHWGRRQSFSVKIF